MSQYRWMGRLFTFATLGALASAGCFVVDDKKSDDEENGGDGSGGTSGSGGSKSTGGSKATGGTGGSDCAADYAACEVNGDCCGYPDTYCVGGGCAPLCTTNAECSTGCCYALEGGGMACAPASLCEGGTGGTGGGAGTGGASTGGAAGTGGGGGGAVMKFCNNLTKNAADVTLTVDFGGVRVSTITGTCTPVVGSPCTTIPTGSAIAANLYDGTTLLFEGEFSLVEAGDEILVLAVLDEVESVPALSGGPFPTGFACSTTDYDDVFTAMLQAKSAHFSNKATWSKAFSANRSLPAIRQTLGSELSAFRSVR